MIVELSISQSVVVRPLFAGFQHILAPEAILTNHCPGRVFADHPTHPAHALIWDGAAHLYLAGDGQACSFHRSMGQILTGEIGPAMLAHGQSYYVLLSQQKIAQNALSCLLPGRHPIPQKRRVYTFPSKRDLPPPRSQAAGTVIIPFTAALLKSPSVMFSGPFTKWLHDTWQDPERLVQYGFGSCILVGDQLAAWCMAENTVEHACEAGIETHPAFRRQGLAYLAAWAFLAQSKEHGLNVYWICREDNRASFSLAEKLGFDNRQDFTAWFGSFDDREEQHILKKYYWE